MRIPSGSSTSEGRVPSRNTCWSSMYDDGSQSSSNAEVLSFLWSCVQVKKNCLAGCLVYALLQPTLNSSTREAFVTFLRNTPPSSNGNTTKFSVSPSSSGSLSP